MLELSEVTRTYVGPSGPLEVLSGVTLSIAPGERIAVVGPSGSGKSTLLNLMGALDVPTSGRVLIEGRDVAALSEADRAALRSARIGFVFQSHHLLPQLTVWENVLVPALVPGVTDDVEERAQRLIERVGLAGRVEHTPGALSGGERQRVAVVRALVNGPSVLLADEPTGSLDRAGSSRLAQLLVELNRDEGVALVVVTHSEPVAESMGRVLALRDGKLAGDRGGT